MKGAKGIFGILLTALFFTATLAAAQPYEESMEESNRQFTEAMEAMGDFVKDVTFDEGDVKAILKYRDELEGIGEDDEEEGSGYDEEDEDFTDFKKLLDDPEYRSWAKSRGLNPDTWMKKFMRFQLMMMKSELTSTASERNAQMKAQMAELEAQRAQMGEEVYQQMKDAMAMGAAAMNNIGDAYKNIPEPTTSEKALVERYRDQFINY